jgi:hypothetical protein
MRIARLNEMAEGKDEGSFSTIYIGGPALTLFFS